MIRPYLSKLVFSMASRSRPRAARPSPSRVRHLCILCRMLTKDPATGNVIGQCPEMTVDDVKEAVQIAFDSFKKYRTTTPKQRQDLLQELYRLYQANINDIARLIVWENGKSWNDAMAEAVYAGSFFQWFAGEAMRSYGDVVPCSLPGTRNFTVKQPVGVCALLVPCVIC